jgi:hypothetical protein
VERAADPFAIELGHDIAGLDTGAGRGTVLPHVLDVDAAARHLRPGRFVILQVAHGDAD